MALRRAVLSTVCSMMIWSLGGFLPGDSRNGARGFHEARGETSVMCEGERGDFLTRSKSFERCGHARDNAAATGVPRSNDSFLLRGEKQGQETSADFHFRGPLEGLFSSLRFPY